jgi:hypothetical protein
MMIDTKAVEAELNHARAACADVQAAISDLEALVWEVAHPEPSRPRLLFVIDGLDPETLPTVN